MPSGILQGIGAIQQAGAAKDASAAQTELTKEQMQNLENAGYTGNQILTDAVPGVKDAMTQGYEGAADYMTQGAGQQRSDILGGSNLATGAITQGMGGGLDALYGGANQGADALMHRQDRAGAQLDQAGGLYGNFQADPGYQFRLQQSEDAMRRQQAASGGRYGGAALQALSDHAQNFASNEFNNYANRQNQLFGANTSSDAQALNATSQAANMAYGAGQGAANIYGQGGSQLAGIYGNTGTQLGNQAATSGQQLGQMTQDYFGGMGNIDWNLAQQMVQNIIGGAGGAAGLTGTANAAIGGAVPYTGAGWTAAGNSLGNLEDLAATAYGAKK